jgi:hypothetical protein
MINRVQARQMLNDGWGIIDASGRTRSDSEQSVIAFASSKYSRTVLFKASLKREILRKYLSVYSREMLIARMHCVGIVLCLKNYLSDTPGVFICSDGIDPGTIRHHLKQMMGNELVEKKLLVHSSLKSFLGKKNIGDRLAYSVNKQGRKPTIEVNEVLLNSYLKKL